jgi:hypothetical protein
LRIPFSVEGLAGSMAAMMADARLIAAVTMKTARTGSYFLCVTPSSVSMET